MERYLKDTTTTVQYFVYVKVVEIRISAMLVSVCHPKESKFLVYTGSPSRLACTAPTLFRTA